ncbi:MAG: hypothetical protein HUU06_11695 [Planctomycetaceae bacterium]|nr:hypothetical protein [Planctomycetota bacterium]NUN53434.1 hypothetical protein [Planctomycetaceae bacterium]
MHRSSILFVTLDSCRYDTFEAADAPRLKAVGPLVRAMAPGYFTYPSHCAMFMGFTPSVPDGAEPYSNLKIARIFRLEGGAGRSSRPAFAELQGASIMDGLKRLGYLCIGTGSVDWFNPTKPTSRRLVQDFDRYFFPGNCWSLDRQLAFLEKELEAAGERPVLLFLNLGETHVPYYFEGADWSSDPESSPCRALSSSNDAVECRRRQKACLEFVDGRLGPLLDRFRESNTVICADHGDAWGEGGLWGHGFHHPKVVEVPLLFSLRSPPPAAPPKGILSSLLGR